jgi:hypothetical protein
MRVGLTPGEWCPCGSLFAHKGPTLALRALSSVIIRWRLTWQKLKLFPK